MKISEQRFKEILSLYFDKEESELERNILLRCIKESPRCAKLFLDYQKMHFAICRMSSQKIDLERKFKFTKIAIRVLVKAQKKRDDAAVIIKKWSLLAVMAVLCFSLLFYAIYGFDEAPNKNLKVYAQSASVVPIYVKNRINPFGNGYFTGIISFEPDASDVAKK